MKKIFTVILTALMIFGAFTRNIAAQPAVDPDVTVTFNETSRTIDVISTADYVSKVTEADTDTAIYLDTWSVWGRESNVVIVNSAGNGFSIPVSNALGDQTGTFVFKILMNEKYKNDSMILKQMSPLWHLHHKL